MIVTQIHFLSNQITWHNQQDSWGETGRLNRLFWPIFNQFSEKLREMDDNPENIADEVDEDIPLDSESDFEDESEDE